MKWEELSMSDRSNLMKTYLQNGVTQLSAMRDHYNKFADGGEVDNVHSTQAQDFIASWLSNRQEQFRENFRNSGSTMIPYSILPKSWSDRAAFKEYQNQLKNLRTVKQYDVLGNTKFPHVPDSEFESIKKLSNHTGGAYNPSTHAISYISPYAGTDVHELTHSLNADPQINAIKYGFEGDKLQEGKQYNSYKDSANEIYSRLMQFRYLNKLDPTKKYSVEDIKKWREKYDDTDIVNRYTDEYLLHLLNNVASTKSSLEKDGKKMAAYGGRLESSGEVLNNITRKWMRDKNGEYKDARKKNLPRPEFWDRLRDSNRGFIQDWENPQEIATHKLSYGEVDGNIVIYPEVQFKDDKLVDFSRPPYSSFAALEEALDTGNYTTAPNEKIASNFTRTYKQHYPGFEENNFLSNESDRSTYQTSDSKAQYIYRKMLASGYNPAQVSAILGQIFVESGLDEYKKERGHEERGYGLMQWTDPSRKAKLAEFKSPTARNEFEKQVDFIIHELPQKNVWIGKDKYISKFKNSSNVDEITSSLMRGYLNPEYGPGSNINRRTEVANYYYNNPPMPYTLGILDNFRK